MLKQVKYPALQQQKLLDYAAVSHPVLLRVQVYAARLNPVSLFVLVCADVYDPDLSEKRSSVQLQE